MKKNINKRAISIIVAIVVLVAIGSLFYIKNKSDKAEASAAAPVVATVRKASFGSVVNVTLSDAGKKQYKGAVKYRVYYNHNAITQQIEIGKPTTAFPVRKVNDKVEVSLIKADGKEAYKVELDLQKADSLKAN